MTWTFIWMLVILKIPIIALLYIVWWAVHAEAEPASSDDGGTKITPRPHPRKPLPRGPRRGPHGLPAPASPPRVRSAAARARTVGR